LAATRPEEGTIAQLMYFFTQDAGGALERSKGGSVIQRPGAVTGQKWALVATQMVGG